MSGEDERESAAGLLRKALSQLEAFPPQGLGRMHQLDDSSSGSATLQPPTYGHPRSLPRSFIPRTPSPTPQVKTPAQLLIRNRTRTDQSHSCSEQRDYALGNNFSWSEHRQSSPERSAQYREAPLSAYPRQLQMRYSAVNSHNGEETGSMRSSRTPSYYLEHKRLFGGGYQPSASVSTRYRGGSDPFTTPYKVTSKGKNSKRMIAKSVEKSRLPLWKKEVVCLKSKDDHAVPNTAEKIALAKIGLMTKEVKFDLDGDGLHLDAVLKNEYPELQFTGGYSLLRPLTNSRDLAIIDPPKGGFTIRYLKDILRSARLYVRPLQENISAEAAIVEGEKDAHDQVWL